MLLERDAVATLPGPIGGQGFGAERVTAEVGDGALRNDVVVVGAGDDRPGREKLVLIGDALEEGELDCEDGVFDRNGLWVLRHWRGLEWNKKKKKTVIWVY